MAGTPRDPARRGNPTNEDTEARQSFHPCQLHRGRKTTEFCLLPQALDLSLTPSEQSFTADRVILAKEDRCLRVSAIHLLEQDRYVT